jgi:hypothetical protein
MRIEQPDTKRDSEDAIRAQYQEEYDRLRKINSAHAKAKSLQVKSEAYEKGFIIG